MVDNFAFGGREFVFFSIGLVEKEIYFRFVDPLVIRVAYASSVYSESVSFGVRHVRSRRAPFGEFACRFRRLCSGTSLFLANRSWLGEKCLVPTYRVTLWLVVVSGGLTRRFESLA